MTTLRQWLLAMVLAWACASVAHAHLVVSQHGTLNIVGGGAYMVLSLPVSALAGVDDDQDGLLSIDELRTHGSSIESQIKQGVALDSDQGRSALEVHHAQYSTARQQPSGPIHPHGGARSLCDS